MAVLVHPGTLLASNPQCSGDPACVLPASHDRYTGTCLCPLHRAYRHRRDWKVFMRRFSAFTFVEYQQEAEDDG